MKSASPTKLTCDELKTNGVAYGVVEQTIPHTFIKRDFIGVIDIIACIGGKIVGIQATSDSNHAARRTKAEAEPRLVEWLRCGAVFQIWSWKTKKEPCKKATYSCRVEELTL